MARTALDRFQKNPLLEEAEFTFKRRTTRASKGDDLVNIKTGQIEACLTIQKYEMTDPERFTKVFFSGITEAFKLSSPSQKVFTTVLKLCEKDSDIVYIDINTVREIDPEISLRTYQRGMSELISRKFLAATVSMNRYFINPHLFFNGSRINFITTYVLEHDSTGAKRTPKDVK